MWNLKEVKLVVVEKIKFKVRVHIETVLNVVLRTLIYPSHNPQTINSATTEICFGAS